jgi:acetoacetyl-CoA synthetase
MTGERPIWTPSNTRASASQMARFMDHVRQEYAEEIENYAGLHRWSVSAPEKFWPALWAFCGIRASRSWDDVLADGERMPGTRWFTGARLNFAENLLRYRDDRPALVFRNERGDSRRLTYRELYADVARLAAALRAAGVGPGDRVAGYMPNLPETVIAMLATSSIGAIWSSCSQDFGVNGLLDRFGQIGPKLLIAADGYWYAGKRIEALPKVKTAAASLPSVERIVIVPMLEGEPDLADLPKAVAYADFVASADETATEEALELTFAQLPFDNPVYILYSSGTTGKPKCIVHGAGGTLIQHLKELVLHTDLRREDRFIYFTTCGWMMWNWLVSGLAVGATIVLYDGSPFHPGPEALPKLIEDEDITVFGASAKYFSALEKTGCRPRRAADLSSLKTILSTGSPLLPENYDFIYRDVHDDVCLSSISGGTDIVSCFVLGNPMLPVWRGEIQCRGLGMDVQVYNDDGKPVRNEKGELVCARPFPSMPIGFWNDPDQTRYRNAYFDRFPNVWCHGDYAELSDRDTVIIYGRSDAVLNPGGVRIGTAEIYRQVEQLDEVVESIAVGQYWQGDQRVILFLVLRDGLQLDDDLRTRIRQTIRDNATPRHVPAKILQVPEIPRTVSGKIVELAVQQVIHGEDVKNVSALANPDALEHFRKRQELED